MTKPKLKIVGLHTTTEEDKKAALAGDFPLFLSLYLDGRCNIQCKKCSEHPPKYENGLTEEEQKDVLEQLADMGGKALWIFGHNEPLINPRLNPLATKAASLGLETVVFTNATPLTRDRAAFLYDQGVSLVLSIDTFDRATYDTLVDNGNYDATMRGLEAAQEAGFNSGDGKLSRLGLNVVIQRPNLEQIPGLSEYARDNHIAFFLSQLFTKGRAQDYQSELYVSPEQVQAVLEPAGLFPPHEFFLQTGGCLLLRYGTTLMPDGNIKGCSNAANVIGNIRDAPLQDLVRQQRAFYGANPMCITDKGG